MKTLKNNLFYILMWTWCLPQNLLGLIIFIIKKGEKIRHNARIIDYCNMTGGLSLGMFIFIDINRRDEAQINSHELGHTYQSMLLGPLYLLVVGLPSLIWCRALKKIRQRKKLNYSALYCEGWADKLGNKHYKGENV